MCGRFALLTEPSNIYKLFKVEPPDEGIEFSANFNVAPTTQIPIAITSQHGPRLISARWGLIPHWAKDPKISYKLINARSESVFEKPSFRGVISKRRCLIPTDGFYEWLKEGRGKSATKRPHFIHHKDHSPLVMAGLWTTWKNDEGEVVPSFSILTCEPNPLVAKIHGRMPVILPPSDFEQWIDPELSRDGIESMLRPYPQGSMDTYEVSSYVGSVHNKGPKCMAPIPSDAPALARTPEPVADVQQA